MDRPETVAELTQVLRDGGYLADRGLATALFVVAVAGPPDPDRGRGRRRQDRGREGARGGVRAPADPAAVLRGHRHQPGPVRVGLRPADAADPRAVRAAAGRRRRGRQAVRPEVPARAAAAGGGARRRPGRPAHRRGRPGRRRVRGVPARDAVRLPDHHPGDRHHPGRDAAAGHPDLQPHPGAARRAEAALPLPLGRLPERRARGGDRPGPGAGGVRGADPQGGRRGQPAARASTWPSRRAWPRRSTGSARSRCSARPSSTPQTVEDTLGAVVKERDDLELVRANLDGIASGG